MMSKKEEEKNEKIIRALRKLPHNRTCMNCNSLGPQYVCTTFWTFVCTACSGIHREFTHRVKSVSMAKFTAQEVHALQNGGNQRARDIFLKHWDAKRMKFPESSNADKIREFINNVYIHKKYAGERYSEKPLRDMKEKNKLIYAKDIRSEMIEENVEGTMYCESIHKDRHIGKSPIITITRLSDSNSDLSERTSSSSIYSPQQLIDYIHAEKFGKGITSLFSPEFEVSRTESFRSASESFRSASDSFISARESFRSACLDSEMDAIVTECDNSTTPALSQSSTPMHVENQDFDNEPFMQPTTAPLTCFIELFEHRPSHTTFSKNEEWTTFDMHEPVGGFSQTNTLPPGNHTPKVIENAPTSMHNSEWCSFLGSLSSEQFTSTSDQLHISVQPLHSFDGCNRNMSDTLFGSQQLDNQLHVPVHASLACSELNIRLQRLENPFHNGYENCDEEVASPSHATNTSAETSHIYFGEGMEPTWVQPYNSENNGHRRSALDDIDLGLGLSPTSISISSFPPSVLPQAAETIHAPRLRNPFDLPYDLDSKASNEADVVHARKSTNPFDLPYDFDSKASNEYFYASSSQVTMPYSDVPNFFDVQSNQWLPHSSIPRGGMTNTESPMPSSMPLNPFLEGYSPSRPGNPFA